jgi:hypothetical protein
MTTLFAIILSSLLWPPRAMACASVDFSNIEIAVTGSCPSGHNFLCRQGVELEAGTWTVCCDNNECHLSTYGTACEVEHFCDAP